MHITCRYTMYTHFVIEGEHLTIINILQSEVHIILKKNSYLPFSANLGRPTYVPIPEHRVSVTHFKGNHTKHRLLSHLTVIETHRMFDNRDGRHLSIVRTGHTLRPIVCPIDYNSHSPCCILMVRTQVYDERICNYIKL